MNRKIRNHVFETNSSSVHSLVISNNGREVSNFKLNREGKIEVDFGDFGKELRVYTSQYDKLSYLITCLYYLSGYEVDGLFSGHSKSCGCIRRKTHGKSHTKFYQQYYGMIKRCELKTHKEYKDYGGRGIKVCDEWRSNFQSFYDWSMSNGYEDGLTIERIDVNGDYCPENCQWIPLSKQMFNKRNNIFLEYEGRILTLEEWSKQEDVSIPYGTILRRYHCGWSAKDILFKETRK